MTKETVLLYDMARSFQDVLAEVTARSDPQRKIVLDQVAALPGQQQADEAGLEAKKTQAFDDILGGARRRGIGFSGIPLGEQAKYTATEYAPAVANMKAGYNTRKGTLESALADIGKNDYGMAQDIFNRDRDYEFRQQQFEYQRQQDDLNRRAAAASARGANSFSPSLGGGGNSASKSATMAQRADKGFAFTDVNGNPISAATYASQKGIPFRTLLQSMANAGDTGAKAALGFVGDDYGYNPNKVNAAIYNSLVWDTGRSAKQPARGGGGGW